MDFSKNLSLLQLFGAFTKYDEYGAEGGHSEKYPYFQDVHIMMLVGFGFLMTVVSRYSWSALGFNFLLTVLVIQWHTLVSGFWASVIAGKFEVIKVGIDSLITGDFAAACVLIAFGAVLGRTSTLQLAVLACLQIVFFSLNEHLVVHTFNVADVGGSMVVHVFGAYFGLAASWVLGPNAKKARAATSKTNSVTAMIGTLFLFAFWPSFNGAMATGAAQHRVVVNTVIALCGSAAAAFTASSWLRGGKFDMEDIQNATLAGGVAVGSSANFVLQPWGSMLIGLVAGVMSVGGYIFLTPILHKKAGVEDTCGVHNLHGMPGVFAGVVSSIVAATVSAADYGGDAGLSAVFSGNSYGYSASRLAANQFYTLLVSVCICLLGGLLTGLLLKQLPVAAEAFDDAQEWEVHGLDQNPNGTTPTRGEDDFKEQLVTISAVKSMIDQALQHATQAAGATALAITETAATTGASDVEVGLEEGEPKPNAVQLMNMAAAEISEA